MTENCEFEMDKIVAETEKTYESSNFYGHFRSKTRNRPHVLDKLANRNGNLYTVNYT